MENKSLINDPNKIPTYLEYLGHRYKFVCNKGEHLCYIYEPKYFDGSCGSTIIVEHRKNKRWVDRFYVLFHICGCNGYDNGYTSVSNLKGYTRQAKPILN